MLSLVGRKCGMTRIFLDNGNAVPVSVIHVEPNVITQVKNTENDGYTAIQVTTGEKKASKVNKPSAGHFAKANVKAGRGLWEMRVAEDKLNDYQVGQELKVDLFQEGQMVDVSGITKGKGFAGTVKRHHFRTQDATHGNSRSHRVPGSTGQNQTPGRVFKGKKMAGHLGDVKRTIQSLKIIRIDSEKQLLLVKGSIPGAIGRDVVVSAAVKA